MLGATQAKWLPSQYRTTLFHFMPMAFLSPSAGHASLDLIVGNTLLPFRMTTYLDYLTHTGFSFCHAYTL